MTPGFHWVGGGAIPRNTRRVGPSWEWGDHGVSLGHVWRLGHLWDIQAELSPGHLDAHNI